MSRFDNLDCMMCGIEFQVIPSRKNTAKYCSPNCRYKSQVGTKHTAETKKKMSLNMIGDKNPMKNPEVARKSALGKMGELNHIWRGGISKKKNFRYNRQYKKWRLEVLGRDNNTCRYCGTNKDNGYDSYMTAHHIKEFWLYPELRYEIDNGICLCVKCHSKETSREMRNNYNGKRKVA